MSKGEASWPATLVSLITGERDALQAQKFGIRIKLAAKAVSLSSQADLHRGRVRR
jgi:hypothetical protein